MSYKIIICPNLEVSHDTLWLKDFSKARYAPVVYCMYAGDWCCVEMYLSVPMEITIFLFSSFSFTKYLFGCWSLPDGVLHSWHVIQGFASFTRGGSETELDGKGRGQATALSSGNTELEGEAVDDNYRPEDQYFLLFGQLLKSRYMRATLKAVYLWHAVDWKSFPRSFWGESSQLW